MKFRAEERAWFRALSAETPPPTYEAREKDWGYSYPPELAHLGYWLFKNSDYREIPDPEQLQRLDPEWIALLFQMAHLDRFHNAPNPILDLAAEVGPNIGTWAGNVQNRQEK